MGLRDRKGEQEGPKVLYLAIFGYNEQVSSVTVKRTYEGTCGCFNLELVQWEILWVTKGGQIPLENRPFVGDNAFDYHYRNTVTTSLPELLQNVLQERLLNLSVQQTPPNPLRSLMQKSIKPKLHKVLQNTISPIGPSKCNQKRRLEITSSRIPLEPIWRSHNPGVVCREW
jgi:hypothetical protein